jgi:hypothetical protein
MPSNAAIALCSLKAFIPDRAKYNAARVLGERGYTRTLGAHNARTV